MYDDLRRALAERGVPHDAVWFPGEVGQPAQGALTVREVPAGYELATIDYGTPAPLARADSTDEIGERLIAYLEQSLPESTWMARADFDALRASAAAHYADLRQRLEGGGSLLIRLPAGLAVDRVGLLDGVQLFPADTPIEERSLPPLATEGSAKLHRFITGGDVLVRIEIVKPWFGFPGGGLRLTLGDDFVGIRDLVASGRLRVVEVL